MKKHLHRWALACFVAFTAWAQGYAQTNYATTITIDGENIIKEKNGQTTTIGQGTVVQVTDLQEHTYTTGQPNGNGVNFNRILVKNGMVFEVEFPSHYTNFEKTSGPFSIITGANGKTRLRFTGAGGFNCRYETVVGGVTQLRRIAGDVNYYGVLQLGAPNTNPKDAPQKLVILQKNNPKVGTTTNNTAYIDEDYILSVPNGRFNGIYWASSLLNQNNFINLHNNYTLSSMQIKDIILKSKENHGNNNSEFSFRIAFYDGTSNSLADGSGGGINQKIITIKDERTPQQFTLTTQSNNTAWGEVSPPTGKVNSGAQVTLTATPKAGATFVGWAINSPEQIVSNDNPYTPTINQDVTIIGVFEKQEVPVSQLRFTTPSSLILQKGKSYPLQVEVLPANATNKNLAWVSSQPQIVRVHPNGMVTALNKGEAIITATTQDGSGLSAQTRVRVMVPTTKITLTLPQNVLSPNLNNVAIPVLVEPQEATPNLYWQSTNPNVVSVNAQGKISTHQAGTAIITATAQDGSGVSAQIQIEVKIPVQRLSVEIEGNQSTLPALVRRQLRAVITPTNATEQGVSWRSSNEQIVYVSPQGQIHTRKVGEAVITATSNDAYAGYPWAQITIKVENPSVAVSQISISPANSSLLLGGTAQLTAAVQPANATNKEVSWASSAPAIVSVNAQGEVTAHQVGEATITATAEDGSGVSAQATIKVSPISVTGIVVTPNALTLQMNQTAQLTAAVQPANATNKEVSWASSAPAIVSVNAQGEVTAQQVGEAIVTATAKDGSGVSAQATIKVSPISVTSIVVTPNALTLQMNQTAQLTAEVQPADATNKEVSWASSAPAIVSVNAQGEVTTHQVGEAIVTATAKDGNHTASALVFVNQTDQAFKVPYLYGLEAFKAKQPLPIRWIDLEEVATTFAYTLTQPDGQSADNHLTYDVSAQTLTISQSGHYVLVIRMTGNSQWQTIKINIQVKE